MADFDDALVVIRQHTGTATATPDGHPYTYADVSRRYDRLGDPHKVAAEILRQQRADLLADPTNLTLVGDLSYNANENLRALDARIAELDRHIARAAGNDPDALTVAQLTRPDRGR